MRCTLHVPKNSSCGPTGGSRGPTIEIIEIWRFFWIAQTNEVDVLHLCRALESSNASVYIDLSQTPVSNTGTWETAQTH